MRSILQHCIEMDTVGERTYHAMADATDDAELASAFRALAVDEAGHVEWWRELLQAWEQGLVPDIVNDTEGFEDHIRRIRDQLVSEVPADPGRLTDEQMVATAARMEFYMLDSAFGELLDLTEPGVANNRRKSYGTHVERLLGLIERHHEGDDLSAFLARVLRRAWGDNLKLAAYASRDALTELYNRRGLMNNMRHWTAWAARYSRPLAVLLVDVDDFKRVNDTYGHSIGDDTLRAVAGALVAAVRDSDLVARYGGDEFAVLAPETDVEELRQLVARVVREVRQVEVAVGMDAALSVTVSVGGAVTTVSPLLSAETTPDALLAAADRSLYEAKQTGKDRGGQVRLANGPELVT